MDVRKIAELCHEVNRAYCEAIGDFSQKPWDESPEWQRAAAINGVEFHLINPGASAIGSHENWMKVKLEEGWKWGPVKDVDKKEHPCLVPYFDLPAEQRTKDFLFKAVVETASKFK